MSSSKDTHVEMPDGSKGPFCRHWEKRTVVEPRYAFSNLATCRSCQALMRKYHQLRNRIESIERKALTDGPVPLAGGKS